MSVVIDITIPELEAYVKVQEMLRLKTSPKNVPPLTEESLKELVAVAHEYGQGKDFDLLRYESYSQACGCMGPSGDYKMCPCMQSYMLEVYKLEVALAIAKHDSSLPSS